jgi:DNA-binding LacI/PurR family transcriptional regulator
VTQRDIAEAVGVSHVTVSHVLHRSQRSRVSAEMQRRIQRVAAEMGYTPRAVTTHTIAVAADPTSLWWDATANILTYADEVIREHGYRMAVSTLDATSMKTAPTLFYQKTVDGVIFTEWYARAARHFHALCVPWLLLADADEPGLEGHVHQVGTDTVGTARTVTERLLREGHERFCILLGPISVGYHQRLMRGVLQALGNAGLPLDNVSVIRNDEEERIEMEDALLPLLQSTHPPTAIITGSPGGAMVILNRLQRNGYRVPEQVSVISLTDSPRLTALRPAVTATTATGRKEVRLAVEALIEQIKRPQTAPQRALMMGEIIERDSVAPAQSSL